MPNRYTFLVAGIFIGIAPLIQAKEIHVSDLELINNSSSAKQNDPLGNRGIVDLSLSTHQFGWANDKRRIVPIRAKPQCLYHTEDDKPYSH